MIIRAIDFETTGIPTESDPHAVVEIGWTDLPATGWNDQLVNPGRSIPFEAMAVHHITDEMVAMKPDWRAAIEMLCGEPDAGIEVPDYFAAHNADYERQFLKTEIPFICTFKVAVRLWPDAPSHSLQYLRYDLGLPVRHEITMPHRAGPDAYLCALLLERIMAEPNAPDNETMVRWSNGPALLTRVNFGKHRGSKWEELPIDYLEWLIFKSDMDRDVKANAKYYLKRRTSLPAQG